MILHQIFIQPTKNPRSVGPHRSKSKTTVYKKKSYMKNKKLRSTSTQLHKGSTEPNTNETNLIRQYIFYTNKDLKSYTSIIIGTSIPIVTWKVENNHSHIINNRPLPSCSSYYENNQRIKCNDTSSIITIKDIELFYCLIKKAEIAHQ